MASKSKQEKEEPKQTLPIGHPQGGYVEPDLSYHEGTGTIPEAEAAWHEDRNSAQQEDAEAVAQSEDEVATKEQEEREKEAKEAEKKAAADKPAEPKTASSSSSSKA